MTIVALCSTVLLRRRSAIGDDRPATRRDTSGAMLLALLLVAPLAASAQGVPAAPTSVRVGTDQPVVPNVQVTVTPEATTLAPRASVRFSATVTGTINTNVTWSATGGTIAADGTYTAGDVAGSFVVTATLTGGTIRDSAAVTIAPATSGTAIDVLPGQSLQSAINAQPAGTTFRLRTGVHRITSPVFPTDGTVVVGEPGAILSGARLLTSFTRSGSYWVATGQTQQGSVVQADAGYQTCTPEAPRCMYPEDLFLDDRLLRHVARLTDVAPGRWFFDYAADAIYMGDDPTGRRVEVGVASAAFDGAARSVTLRALVVEKFATPSQESAIRGGGGSWVVEDCEVRWNHFTGLRSHSDSVARRNHVHHNGAFGLNGSGRNILVEDNEIAYNNIAGYDPYWGAGGTKWVYTDGLTVRRNFSHHNAGPGLWTDINNIRTVYEENRVEDNDLSGIFHEISYAAIIRNNTASRNGRVRPYPFWVDGAGILVVGSPDVEIYGNTLVDNYQGIAALDDRRGSGPYGPWLLRNLWVHDNTITSRTQGPEGSGRTGLIQPQNDPAAFTSQNNRFDRNTYYLGTNARYFMWMNGERTEQEWRGYGQDVNGLFVR